MKTLASVFLFIGLLGGLLGAVVGARQQAPSTVISLTVEVTPKTARILSGKVVRGVIGTANDKELAAVPVGETSMLFEYTITGQGSTKAESSGWFHVDFVPTYEPRPGEPVEDTTPKDPAKLRRVVVVSVPNLPGATVKFNKVTKVPNTPPAKWPRQPVGEAPIPPGIK